MPKDPQGNKLRPGIHLRTIEESQKNPYPIYEKLCRDYPVCQLEPDGMWAVSRYEDVRFALERPDLFSSSGFKALLQPDWLREDCGRDMFILMQDPPEHRKYRALVSKAFAARTIDTLIPLMRQTAENLVGSIQKDKEIDLLEEFAYPYVAEIIGHITGTEDQGLEEIRLWIGLIGKITPIRPDDHYIHDLETAILKQKTRFAGIIRERRKSPRPDLINALIEAEVDGEKLTDSMLENALDLLLAAGFHTSLQTLCQAIMCLSRHPDITQTLIKHPELIPKFIEELLRLESIAPTILRQTTCEVTLSGITIPPGAMVLLILAAANRDPVQFSDPNQFKLSRENPKQHVAFGHGPHLCLGANLARLELKIALEAILSKFNSFSCPANEKLQWSKSAMMRSVSALPVVFTNKTTS